MMRLSRDMWKVVSLTSHVLCMCRHSLLSHQRSQSCKMKLGERAGILLDGLFSVKKGRQEERKEQAIRAWVVI